MNDLEQGLVAPDVPPKMRTYKGWCGIIFSIFCTLLCIATIGFSMYIIYTLLAR